jgi:hypothetical protein
MRTPSATTNFSTYPLSTTRTPNPSATQSSHTIPTSHSLFNHISQSLVCKRIPKTPNHSNCSAFSIPTHQSQSLRLGDGMPYTPYAHCRHSNYQALHLWRATLHLRPWTSCFSGTSCAVVSSWPCLVIKLSLKPRRWIGFYDASHHSPIMTRVNLWYKA